MEPQQKSLAKIKIQEVLYEIQFPPSLPATAQARYSYKQFRLNLVTEFIGDYNSRQ